MTKLKLYELSANYQQVLALLESDEVDQELLESTLDSIGEALDEKVENIAKLVKKYESQSDAIKAEVKRLSDRAARYQKQADKLEDYIKENLQRVNISKIEGKLFTIGFRKSSQVHVTNLDLVPDDYKQTKTEVVPDKKAIGEVLKSGQEVAGCELVINQNLQIK